MIKRFLERIATPTAIRLLEDLKKLKHNPSILISHNKPGEEDRIWAECNATITNRELIRLVGNQTARCSSIYVITRNLPGAPNGGVITYGEFQDMQATAGDVIAWFRQMFGATFADVTDGGRFAVAPGVYGGFCFDAKVLTKPRIRMLMPQLAGRVTNVCCVPTGTYPDVTGSGGIYEVDGGPIFSPPNYLYGDCWPTHVGV